MKRRNLLKIGLFLLTLNLPMQSMALDNNVSKEPTISVNVIITFKIKEEKIKSFLKIMNDVKKNLPKVDGCSDVHIYQNKDDFYTLTLVESWNSIKEHKAHIKHVVDSGDWDYIASHLSEDPISHYYNEI